MAQAMLSTSLDNGGPDSDDDEEPDGAAPVEVPQFYVPQDLDAGGDTELPTQEGPVATHPPTIEEVVDEDFLYFQDCPAEHQAGATFGKGPTTFQAIRDDQVLRGAEVLGPFESDDEWELAKWLIKNVGHNQMEAFLKLPIIQGVGTAYSTKDQLLEAVDDLPGGVGWKLEKVTLKGDLEDDDGKPIVETLELWYRDPVDCIRELMGNPVFCDVMQYAPQKCFEDMAGMSEVINEMWTADWWWKLQKLLPPGATIAPIILSSDKTKLSNFRGDQSAWPVYLTIGNISKDIRRQASSHATVLVGYLPIGKFSGYSDKARQAVRYRTFHHCMSVITRSLVAAGTDGVDMTCSDGFVRWVFPILAAYVADYPEQCLIANCMENRCPICKVAPTSRGTHEPSAPRQEAETLNLLKEHQTGYKNPATAAKAKADYDDFGLRPVPSPFWAQLPHSDIFQAFTPDLLHQLHKGVFKDHLVKWCTKIVGEKEVDARFRSMPSHPDIRHFKNNISSVSQWTGTRSEFKAMEKVFISVVAGAAPDRAVGAARAVLDFIHYSSLQSHTTATLRALAQSLDKFHEHKEIFLDLEARLPKHFNIPKIHSMEHYVALIRLFGSADGYNTESPERLHIDYAKNAYRASNKRDYTIQMTNWLRRQEAVDRFTLYLEWERKGSYQPGEQVSRVPITPPASDDPEGIVVAPTSTSPAATYKIAKLHPRELTNIPAVDIIAGHGAGYFLEALKAYISPFSPLIPQPFDRFNLYKRLTFTLPAIPEASATSRRNVVRVSPPVPARGVRSPAQPAHLDFALVRTGEVNDRTAGTALEGLRVAHVKVLFQLPNVYRLHTTHPLAYVEWYTPFGVADPVSGLHTIRRSTRNNHVYGEIIGVDRIVRNCHLLPKFGRNKDPSWTTENVVERCPAFFPSPYSDTHSFCLFRVGKKMFRS
ncbi:hypothetical protein B0H16DRAFT_1847253 [Mycena metata]|uniref:Uncharacterized protein n=1 Tax=Mycena metata TaxID=1033252 RepID=A0AAD7IS66_9AGAR|nr:hypothetical protein B0H16DRAFT_1847253 [Mycena metata]